MVAALVVAAGALWAVGVWCAAAGADRDLAWPRGRRCALRGLEMRWRARGGR